MSDAAPERPDPDQVAEWFDRHARTIADYATRRVGATLARDIVADTFRIALEQLDCFDPRRGDERAWLFGIATNLIRRHWRSEERRLRAHARSARAEVVPIDPLVGTADRLDARDEYHRVIDAVGRLDADDRDLLVLVAWEGMSSRQAAAVLGITAGTVRSRLSRIRTRLTDLTAAPTGGPHG